MNPKLKIRVIDSYVYKKSDNGFDFLILKRADTKIYEHLWQGIAGKIEKNEKSWQAAIRELKEETGLKPRKIFKADHVSKFYEAHQDRINFVPVFGIEVNNEKVTLSNEHCDYKWVDFETASSHLVWNGQKKGIHAVNQMLLSNDDKMKWSLINFNNISIS